MLLVRAKKTRHLLQFVYFHWNLNRLVAHNFEKDNFLEAYSTDNKFDTICLSETYLDSSILSNNDGLVIKGYKLVRDDHPGNIKKDVVCAYIRKALLMRCLFDTYLKKCLILEACINNKKRVCNIIVQDT